MPTRDELIAAMAKGDGYSDAQIADADYWPDKVDCYGAQADAVLALFAAASGVAVPEPDEQQREYAGEWLGNRVTRPAASPVAQENQEAPK